LRVQRNIGHAARVYERQSPSALTHCAKSAFDQTR
jgi:hypothetical protein